ncbi:MAG: ABC transporter ATP-binding protein, partial [Thermicanus sp.]|nr:ABC transporter ATP-binding protein [Thermicanus sp.]
METLRRLRRFYWPHKHLFFLSILCLFGTTGITLVYPLVLKVTIDDVIGKMQYHFVPWIAGGFLLLMGVKGFLLFIHQYFGDLFGIRAVYELRNELYKKLQYLSFRYYDN